MPRALLDAAAASSVPLRGSQRDEQRMIEAHTTGRVSGHRINRRTAVLSGGSSR
ncbi:hypothetical protein P3H15_11130 [Rhodococcus sp. T2V]|uniref:hypothetical protein n=1 Tax=Rhodococcus sp. T2V TaxID=3034164 RepID=UPI0023E0ADF0|nr:hypothetical protein [Rhodococcus sp. T2V]MDF3305575.1 hypothetical protein [Rhodococcus sp. T2V]